MKINGIRKAVSEYNEFNKGGYYDPHYGRLMYNTETGDIWTDEFWSIGHNSWIEYHDPAIVNVGKAMGAEGITKITMQTVKEFIQKYYN